MSSVTITHLVHPEPRVSRVLLSSIKDAVLGKKYELSVAFVTPAEIKKLNGRMRGTNVPTDILSFSLSPSSGEILFCMREVRRQAPFFERTPSNFLMFLFIHGLLHLKGYAHGSRMDVQEITFRKKFGI